MKITVFLRQEELARQQQEHQQQHHQQQQQQQQHHQQQQTHHEVQGTIGVSYGNIEMSTPILIEVIKTNITDKNSVLSLISINL